MGAKETEEGTVEAVIVEEGNRGTVWVDMALFRAANLSVAWVLAGSS